MGPISTLLGMSVIRHYSKLPKTVIYKKLEDIFWSGMIDLIFRPWQNCWSFNPKWDKCQCCGKERTLLNLNIYFLFLGHDKIVGLLIQNAANVNTAVNDGRTPLFESAFNGNLQNLLKHPKIRDIFIFRSWQNRWSFNPKWGKSQSCA